MDAEMNQEILEQMARDQAKRAQESIEMVEELLEEVELRTAVLRLREKELERELAEVRLKVVALSRRRSWLSNQ